MRRVRWKPGLPPAFCSLVLFKIEANCCFFVFCCWYVRTVWDCQWKKAVSEACCQSSKRGLAGLWSVRIRCRPSRSPISACRGTCLELLVNEISDTNKHIIQLFPHVLHWGSVPDAAFAKDLSGNYDDTWFLHIFCTSFPLSDAKERGGKLLRTVRLMGLLGLRIQNILDAKGESSLWTMAKYKSTWRTESSHMMS